MPYMSASISTDPRETIRNPQVQRAERDTKIETVASTDRKAQRRVAALKAWKTIREKKLRASILETGEGSSAQPANTKIESSSATQGSLEKIGEPRTSVVRTSYGKEIVSEFAKTPADIACGPFWELRWGFRCPLDCSYCYLRGTSRGNMNPRYVPVEYVLDGL